MLTFPELIKEIREEGGLTQEQLARALNVSTILISMIETSQKEVSKDFILKMAKWLDVHPSSIAPFLFVDKDGKVEKLSPLEKKLADMGRQLQLRLIKNKAKTL